MNLIIPEIINPEEMRSILEPKIHFFIKSVVLKL